MANQEIAIQFVPFLGVLVAAYLCLIRPQQNRITEHRQLLASLKTGDRVVTCGGLIGDIVALQGPEIVEIELSSSITVRALRTSIESRFVG